MSRAERLLALIQVLRRHRLAVSGATLADELGVSLRTVYRDIAALQRQGADVDGAPGLGYVLKPGFMLPPLMFGEEEIDALVLGTRWVAERADARLGRAARNALAKIAAVLPPDLRDDVDGSALLIGPVDPPPVERVDALVLRQAIRGRRKLAVAYRDERGTRTERTVWPFALGYFERVRVLVAWCELRTDFRHFRTDRIDEAEVLGTAYPRTRAALLKAWRAAQGIEAG